jgi:hypothetical protein
MQMVPIDDLLPEVLTHVPNCSDPVAFKYLREAAQDVCRQGMMWRENDAFPVADPDAEGVITNQDASIVRIARAKLGDVELEPVTVEWLDANQPGWTEATIDANPARYVTQLTPNTVAVAPRATGTLQIRLVLQPSRTAENVPDWLVEQYGILIGKGAAGKIMMLPDEAVADPARGAELGNEFMRKLDGIALKAQRGQQGARLRTRGRFF